MGARFGRALICACSRVTLADRTPAILVVATEPAGPAFALGERARRLLEGGTDAVALFSTDGALLHATQAGQEQMQGLKTLAALGADALGAKALTSGRADGSSHLGEMSVERIGVDADTVLLVAFQQAEAKADPVEPVATAPQAPSPPEPVAPPPAPIVEPPAAEQPATELPAPEQSAPEQPATEQPVSEPPAVIKSEPPQPAPPPTERRQPQQPLRFVWQMDADGLFTLGSDEFTAVIGPVTAAVLGKPWNGIAASLALDPEGQVARAVASRDTWSGITVAFPVDGSSERLAVELSGLPIFDRERNFRGYRGFGICRDVARLASLMQTRRTDADAAPARPEPPAIREERPALSIVPSSPNVVPFRSSTPPEKAPSLTPVEHKAFGELASRLTARLRDAENQPPAETPKPEEPVAPAAEPAPPQSKLPETPPPATKPPQPQPPRFTADGEDERQPVNDQRPILDRLPVGVLVYRLDNLIYANRAFLDWTGYESLYALTEAGGLDALFVEPSAETPRADNGAKALSIATNRGDRLPVEARLFSTPWNGESALVLMLAHASAPKTDEAAVRSAEAETRELRSIVDAASDGVILLDRDGRVLSLNRSAETLFGYESEELGGLPFAGLFATENQRTALDSLARAGTDSATIEGHEVVGHTRDGRSIPLFMSIGPLAGGEKLCAVFRDVTPWKNSQDDLVRAKQQAEKASSAKSDFLAKISHEIRTPLNAIIGFSEVMMEERFGGIGNERYKQYLKDIHTSGGHLISLLNDLLDLSKIEAGKLELTFASVELNELTQQCVALMQPQANRERIIIRTSLSQTLPLVVADARSVRQIVLNLLSNSIKFTGAGGQVIVSTALNDGGEVVLRVRDTGIGMSEKDIAIALEPFRQLATSARWGSGGTGLGLPLTKALAEANRATFSIKSTVNSGTLVEVSFPGTRLAAE